VDAIRGRQAEELPAPVTIELENRNAFAVELADLGARGELALYGEGCHVQLLMLPSLKRTEALSGCVRRGAVSSDGSIVARCLGESTELFDQATGDLVRTLPGCAPAWQPDGTLTVAHQRAVVRFFSACHASDACIRTLIEERELERAARRHPTVPEHTGRLRVLVDGIAWLSQSEAAVLLSIRISSRLAGIGALSQIAFFESGRLVRTQSVFRHGSPGLAASPRGSYLTQAPNLVLRRAGTQVTLPPHLSDVHSFAWSEDERFLALATRFAVTVVDVASLERYDDRGSGLRSDTLPLSARDVAWR
jgi:hypothetical protein